MSVLRLVIAWLVMAALPLQGFAAASMLFCDKAAHATAAAAASAVHDHAAHGHAVGHDSASHAQDEPVQPGSKLEHGENGPGAAGAGMAVDGHSCPICASCCNLVALSDTPTPGFETDVPLPPPPLAAERVVTRHSPIPDKPPRA